MAVTGLVRVSEPTAGVGTFLARAGLAHCTRAGLELFGRGGIDGACRVGAGVQGVLVILGQVYVFEDIDLAIVGPIVANSPKG